MVGRNAVCHCQCYLVDEMLVRQASLFIVRRLLLDHGSFQSGHHFYFSHDQHDLHRYSYKSQKVACKDSKHLPVM
jgi:hypothetical protein